MKRALALVLAIASVFSLASLPKAAAVMKDRPDIILILTDDQRWDTMQYMPFTDSFFQTKFENGFITNPVCCPSRTSLLTGTYSHTNGVWTNEGTNGGWPQFAAHGWDKQSIATVLQSGGYETGLFGKFLNAWDDTIPLGWDRFVGHASAGLRGEDSPYYDYTMVYEDGTFADYHHEDADYSGDVITNEAIEFMSSSKEPHFTFLSYNTPHSRSGSRSPIPGPGFEDVPVDLFSYTPNFLEEDVSDKPSYIRALPGRPRSLEEYRLWNRQYARTLMSADADIQRVVEAQEVRDPGLSNTLFIFLADNGLLVGNHRRLGKSVPYEESIHVPFMVQGGGFAPGTSSALVANVDVVPTILDLTGLAATWSVEGESLYSVSDRQSILIQGAAKSHPFCGIRLRDRKIVRYGSGEWEYYNLRKDPFELNNRASSVIGRSYRAGAELACEGKLPPDWPRSGL